MKVDAVCEIVPERADEAPITIDKWDVFPSFPDPRRPGGLALCYIRLRGPEEWKDLTGRTVSDTGKPPF